MRLKLVKYNKEMTGNCNWKYPEWGYTKEGANVVTVPLDARCGTCFLVNACSFAVLQILTNPQNSFTEQEILALWILWASMDYIWWNVEDVFPWKGYIPNDTDEHFHFRTRWITVDEKNDSFHFPRL